MTRKNVTVIPKLMLASSALVERAQERNVQIMMIVEHLDSVESQAQRMPVQKRRSVLRERKIC